MEDDIVQLLSPLLVVAALAATQAIQPIIRDMSAASVAREANLVVTMSCHGTRLGNHRGSTCPDLTVEP